MTEQFVGQIKMFAGNFAPRGYALCEGQLLSVSQNDALFSLIGTIYGGDGRTTFGLPDLRGRIPIHQGTGPGLSLRRLGEKAGSERVTISNENQLPAHNHALVADSRQATSGTPAADLVLADAEFDIYSADPPDTAMASELIVDPAGGGEAHDNVMPFVCINFIIALVGVYPSRT